MCNQSKPYFSILYCMCICMYICMCICICMFFNVYLYVYLYFYLYMYLYVLFCVNMCICKEQLAELMCNQSKPYFFLPLCNIENYLYVLYNVFVCIWEFIFVKVQLKLPADVINQTFCCLALQGLD